MSIRRWDPFAELMSMRQLADRLFEEAFGRPPRILGERAELLPLSVDLYETGESYVLKAALPGAKPEDVDISVTGNTISIRAEVKPEEQVVPDRYLYQERTYGKFARDIALPAGVEADKAEARVEHGVLTLIVPKSEEARPKQIKIKTR